jgi:hypothetical protein
MGKIMHRKFHGKHFAKVLFFGIIFLAVFSLIFLILWNLLMPAIFGLPAINYFQAIGLLILSKIIFSGFGRKHGPRGSREYWRKRFEEREKAANEPAAGEST